MKKGLWSKALALALSVGILAGCSVPGGENEEQAQLEQFDIVLDWYPNAIHGFIYEAIDKGYYAEEGLQVNVRFPANVNDGIAMPAAGKADVGMYYLHDVVMARANEGVPVKSIGAVVQSPLNIILSLADQNIHSPKDLEGKTIGYAGTAVSEAMIQENMETEGLTGASVKLMDVGFDLMSSMTTGNVDATIGCMLNHEVPQLEKEGFDVNYYMPNEYGVPDYYELVFVAGDKLISENPEKLARFMNATKKGFADMKANPDEAIEILMKYQNAENFPLTLSVEQQSMDVLLPTMETEDAPFLSQSADVWQKNIDWLYERGLIAEKVEVEDVVATFTVEQ